MMSKYTTWIGRVMSGVAVIFLAVDGIIHIMGISQVVDAFIKLGYQPSVAFGLGVVMLACLILYVIPRTSILGAVLLTGYLGGAVATNLRVSAPLFSTVLFPVYIGILVWGGLYLLTPRFRELFPIKKSK